MKKKGRKSLSLDSWGRTNEGDDTWENVTGSELVGLPKRQGLTGLISQFDRFNEPGVLGSIYEHRWGHGFKGDFCRFGFVGVYVCCVICDDVNEVRF